LRVSRQQEHSVLGQIYAAAADQGSWEAALATVATRIDAGAAFFFSAHSKSDRGAVAHVHNLSQPMVSDFFSHWYTEDVWEHGARQVALRPGQVVLGTQLVPHQQVLRSGYFHDFLRPHGIASMVGSMLFGASEPDGMPLTHLCWYRPAHKEPFGDAHRRQLRRVMPHFQRGLRLRRRLSWFGEGPRNDVLQAMYVAAFELNEQGFVGRHNDAAAALLQALPASCVRFGVLRSIGERCAPALADALAACTPANPVRMTAYLGGEAPQVLVATLVCTDPQSPGRFLLLVELPRAGGRRVAQSVAQLFGLSVAEVRVLGELLEGRAPAAIAEACGTSMPTVRTQISSILAKTGTRGQTELLLLLRSLRF
jgi:DNA-binding CsgD family transcriptional regulator